MKYLFSSFVAMFLLSACNNAGQAPENAVQATEEDAPKFTVAMLDVTHDYVCDMELDRDDFIADTAVYEGKVYGFCSAQCKEDFLSDPQAHLPQN